MIDWITAKVPFVAPESLQGGTVFKCDPEGNIEWQTRCRVPVVGSHDSSLQVRNEGDIDSSEVPYISISGNPVKWFQGHNVFGTDDLVGLVIETMYRLSRILDCPQPGEIVRAWHSGDFKLSRVDINGMFELGSKQRVNSWLFAASRSARTRMGSGVMKGGTLYFQKRSTRWSLKCYSKGEEILANGHQLPVELKATSIGEWAQDKLRIEVTLRSKELKKLMLDVGSAWVERDTECVYRSYVEKLEMSEQRELDLAVIEMPNHLRGNYQLWRDGYDLKQFLKKSTYYRIRAELKEHGVDIAIVNDQEREKSNVVPLVQVLEAKPASVPDWAVGTPLYFEPRRRFG